MNKYLIEILKLRTSLTLPGFGALMIANSKTGKIVLNQLLKYDDKVLAKFIAEKENIDLQEAQNKVSKFVKEIDLELSKGETYDMFQFGKLSKTENGSILFEMDDSMKRIQESPIGSVPKMEKKPNIKPVDNKPKNRVPVIEKKEEVKVVETAPVESLTQKVVKSLSVKEEELIQVPVEKIKEIKVKVVDDNVKKNVVASSKVIRKEVVKSKIETKGLSDKDRLKKEKEANKKWQKTKLGKEEDKKKRKVWPLFLVLLLIVIGIIAFLFQDKLKAVLGMADDVEQVEDIHTEPHNDVVEELVVDTLDSEDDISSEIISETDVVEETVEIEPIVKESANGNYHIIGGAFGDESNANMFATKTGGTVIGRFDGMYQVAVKSYDTRTEVNSALKGVSSEYSGAWVFKYPK
jgi:hypothetical protein